MSTLTELTRAYPEDFYRVKPTLVAILFKAGKTSGFLWCPLSGVTTPPERRVRGIARSAGMTVFGSIPRWCMGPGFRGDRPGAWRGEMGGKQLSLANRA